MQQQYQRILSDLPVGEIRYFETIGSTNDFAHNWAMEGAPDLSLVLADEQTSGRGRMDRKWLTKKNSALAMSLILRPTNTEKTHYPRTTGLLAVSLVESLLELGLIPQLKWPNDVLINNRKVAGILVESIWTGENLDTLILGMGVNVLKDSVPSNVNFSFPATSIENELGRQVDRAKLLKQILTRVLNWRPTLGSSKFLEAWDEKLVYRGQQVQVEERGGEILTGELIGLEKSGGLIIKNEHGKSVTVHFGEAHLRPLA